MNGLTGCLAQTKLETTGCCLWAKAWTEAIDQPVLALLWRENSSSFQHWVVPIGQQQDWRTGSQESRLLANGTYLGQHEAVGLGRT